MAPAYLDKCRPCGTVGSVSPSQIIQSISIGNNHGLIAFAPGTSSLRETVPIHEFVWIREGSATISVGKRKIMVSRDSVLLLPPNQTVRYDWGPFDATIAAYFQFEMSQVPSDLPAPSTWPLLRVMPPNDIIRPLFEYVIGNNHRVVHPVPPMFERAVLAMVTAFVSGPLDRPIQRMQIFPDPIQRTLQWMMDTLNTTPALKVTLADLAMAGGVTPKHLCHIFQKYLHYSPLETLYIYRVTRSLIHLQAGWTVSRIAQELGFSSSSHYTRRFTAWAGRSPIAMRRAMARGYKPKLPKLPFMGE